MVCPNDSTVDHSSGDAGTTPLVRNLYQGMLQDPATGLYYERARWYSPSVGTWTSQDPAGFVNGTNTYQFVRSNPVDGVDPSGLALSANELARVVWAESSLIFPQFNKKGPQNGTNYNPASQAALNLAREDMAAVASVNSLHARPAKPTDLPKASGNRFVYNEWLDTLAAAKAATVWLAKHRCPPKLYFFLWPSDNGKTPKPRHVGNAFVYDYPIIAKFGPFRKLSTAGDVPQGNNIYIFICTNPKKE